MAEGERQGQVPGNRKNPEGFYIYCFVRCAQELIFDGVEAMGEPGGAVRTILQNGLTIVVSSVMSKNSDRTSESNCDEIRQLLESDSPVKQYESTKPKPKWDLHGSWDKTWIGHR